MVVPPDSNNPSAPPPAGAHGTDLTLNGPASAADVDAVPDLRLKSEVDSLSSFASERVPRPHVAIFFPGEAERPWWSRLLSLKAPWKKELPPLKVPAEKEPLPPIIHDELVTMEAIGNFEKPLASRATLPDVSVAEGLWDPSTIVHKLERVEEALRRSQQSFADSMLPEMGVNIEKQFGQVRLALQRTEEAVADRTVHELCRNIDARLERTEATLHRSEGIVAEQLQELAAHMTARFGEVDETLRLTQKSLADSMPAEMGLNIERQLIQAQTALQRTEEAVTDTTLHELCQNIDARLERTEDTLHRGEGIVAESLQEFAARMTARFGDVEDTLRLTQKSLADSMPPEMGVNIERQLTQARTALQRTEEALSDRTLHELCQKIEARLERTEDMLHRNEGLVAERLQDFSARLAARLATVEETIQRIEQVVSSRIVEPQPSVRMDDRLVQAKEAARPAGGGVLPSAVLFLNRLVKIKPAKRPIQLPWMAGLAVPVLVVVAVLGIGNLIRTSRGVTPESTVPLATAATQNSTPVVTATNPEIRPASKNVVMANGPRSTRERLVSPPAPAPAPARPSPTRGEAPATTRPPAFVGTLSITSVPSGASVSINGKPAGVTPLRLPRQRAGSLAVQIAHDGFERWSAAVRVPADRLTNVNAKLRATAR